MYSGIEISCLHLFSSVSASFCIFICDDGSGCWCAWHPQASDKVLYSASLSQNIVVVSFPPRRKQLKRDSSLCHHAWWQQTCYLDLSEDSTATLMPVALYRDYTNPMLPVAPHGVDPTLSIVAPPVGGSGKGLPPGNVLHAAVSPHMLWMVFATQRPSSAL